MLFSSRDLSWSMQGLGFEPPAPKKGGLICFFFVPNKILDREARELPQLPPADTYCKELAPKPQLPGRGWGVGGATEACELGGCSGPGN